MFSKWQHARNAVQEVHNVHMLNMLDILLSMKFPLCASPVGLKRGTS